MMRAAVVLLLAAVVAPAWAAGGAPVPYRFKADTGNEASLQRGAANYMNYCVGCHSLQYLRYNRIGKDLNIPEDLLKKHLMPADAKVGDVITTVMPDAAETWFGRKPPDLTLTARERGPSWVYSYLLTFHVDPSKPAGTDNLVLPGASMPHVLGELQGYQKLVEKDDGHGKPVFKMVKEGSMSAKEYEGFVGDLTNFMVYAAEPGREARKSLGWKVLLYILLFWGLAYLLKKEYWKDVH